MGYPFSRQSVFLLLITGSKMGSELVVTIHEIQSLTGYVMGRPNSAGDSGGLQRGRSGWYDVDHAKKVDFLLIFHFSFWKKAAKITFQQHRGTPLNFRTSTAPPWSVLLPHLLFNVNHLSPDVKRTPDLLRVRYDQQFESNFNPPLYFGAMFVINSIFPLVTYHITQISERMILEVAKWLIFVIFVQTTFAPFASLFHHK